MTGTSSLVLLARTAALFLALSARAGELGGHAPPEAVTERGNVTEPYGEGMPLPNSLESGPLPRVVRKRPEDRTAVLEEMWQRRLLSPDQSSWSPTDAQLLGRIRQAEPDALAYLKKTFGGTRPWTAVVRGKGLPQRLLTRAGYEKYLLHLTRDAIAYFEAKGADAKWALKLTDGDGKRIFDPEGRLTEAGTLVYQRAKLKLEVYWKSPNGETFGTRRPPTTEP